MLCGSAFKNKGVQPLLDAIIWYLPSPLDVPPMVAHDLKGEEVTRAASDEEPFSALAFKIMSDPYVGRLTYLRVYSGVLKAGSHVLNSTKDRKERIGRILQMHANHREDKDAAYTRATSWPSSDSSTPRPATPSRTRTIPSSWSPSRSRSP